MRRCAATSASHTHTRNKHARNIIVRKHHDVKKVVSDHAEIQQEIKKGLAQCEKVIVSKNPVHRFKTVKNEECITFLSRTLERLGVREEYDSYD